MGSVEGLDGWNTVVVRNKKAEDIMQAAVDDNYIEIDQLPKENFNHLKEASLNKREKGRIAREEMRQRES